MSTRLISSGGVWILDAGTEWQAQLRTNLEIDARDALSIRPLTGRADPLPAGDTVGPARCPAALTSDCDGTLLVLDAATAKLTRIGSRCEEAWLTIGGNGTAARRFNSPRGVAILPSGNLAIADTGNHRVQIFAAATETLIQSIGARDEFGEPRPGSGRLEFNQPWDVAGDRAGNLYVADRGNARVQVIAADGTWRRDLGSGFLKQPMRVACSRDGALAVVDTGLDAVLIFTRGRRLPRVLAVSQAASVAFGSDGRLFVGDERGTLHSYQESARGSGRYEPIGVAPTGLTRPIIALAAYGKPQQLALIVDAPTEEEIRLHADMRPEDTVRRLWRVDPAGSRALEGVLLTDPIDSGRERHHWHRIRIEAEVPDGTSIHIESATAEEPESLLPLTWTTCLHSGTRNPDCLVQSGAGRYLWLKLTLRSNGRVAPSLRRITVSLGSGSLLQYLPAVFQEDEQSRRFLERFLAIFQSGFDDLNELVETLGDLFEPHRTRARFLPWLAQWIGLAVDPTWSEDELRVHVASAVQSYGRRGTADGLRAAIRAYARVDARMIEHFRLRQLARLNESSRLDGSGSLWSEARTERLQLGSYSQIGYFRLTSWPEPAIEALEWGAHRFTVLFDSDPYSVAETADRVTRVVEREKPAHTKASICPVFPRMRLGVQARLDIDASVGDISYTVLSRLATLNYDTILGCSVHDRALSEHGSARRPRVGETTRLA